MAIPVIDLFAGPGGLGEGFASLHTAGGRKRFLIRLAIESDPFAHQTLELRSFFREFPTGSIPQAYYEALKGQVSLAELFRSHPRAYEAASRIAWNATLGVVPDDGVSTRIKSAVRASEAWVLLGGPPCQVYSLVGRSRVGGIRPNDRRLALFKEYLKVLARHRPAVFVLENVKGLLSSNLRGDSILERLLHDLQYPAGVFARRSHGVIHTRKEACYRLYSFVKSSVSGDLFGAQEFRPEDFVIRSEEHGIPQARHRLIILGVRDDLRTEHPRLLPRSEYAVSVADVIGSLPRVRSGLSRQQDGPEDWKQTIRNARCSRWYLSAKNSGCRDVCDVISRVVDKLAVPRGDRGEEFVSCSGAVSYEHDWYHDERLEGVCNHSTRSHIPQDLHRYLFAACFAAVRGSSPVLRSFPIELLPDHRNIHQALTGSHFADRFRVQVKSRPATTITSHIARDGHYYIHYDPTQCRSLTVREAARIQTFPDNYFFCGPRTSQYIQVGNAVPPLLARQMAELVFDLLRKAGLAG